jgi:hypothetical protein
MQSPVVPCFFFCLQLLWRCPASLCLVMYRVSNWWALVSQLHRPRVYISFVPSTYRNHVWLARFVQLTTVLILYTTFRREQWDVRERSIQVVSERRRAFAICMDKTLIQYVHSSGPRVLCRQDARPANERVCLSLSWAVPSQRDTEVLTLQCALLTHVPMHPNALLGKSFMK